MIWFFFALNILTFSIYFARDKIINKARWLEVLYGLLLRNKFFMLSTDQEQGSLIFFALTQLPNDPSCYILKIFL